MKKNKIPLVSICVPTYNADLFLNDCLESIKTQTYKNIEVVCSDDESTDSTINILEKFKTEVNFPVIILNHNRTSIGENWNNCLHNSNGEFIKFIFQDDIMEPKCVEELMFHFHSQEGIALIACKRKLFVFGEQESHFTDWIKIYKDLQDVIDRKKALYFLMDKSLFKSKHFLKRPLNKIGEPSTFLFRKDILSELGYFNENLKQILDYEFCYRVLKIHKILILNKELVSIRIHRDQETNVNRSRNIDDYIIYYKILFNEYFGLLSWKVKLKLLLKFSFIYRFLKPLFFTK